MSYYCIRHYSNWVLSVCVFTLFQFCQQAAKASPKKNAPKKESSKGGSDKKFLKTEEGKQLSLELKQAKLNVKVSPMILQQKITTLWKQKNKTPNEIFKFY